MKLFILYGLIISMLFFGAGMRGFAVSQFVQQGSTWGSGSSHGHGFYHK